MRKAVNGGAEATFSAAVELDGDLLVHVLAQVEDVFLLGPVVLLTVARCCSTATSASAPSSPVAASASSSSTPELTAVRHGFVGWGGYGWKAFYSQLRHRKLRGQTRAVLRGPSRFFRHGVGGLAGFGVGAGADPAGFWRRLEYAMPAELSRCGESRGCMDAPPRAEAHEQTDGTIRGSSAGQSFYTDAVQRRERMCRAVSSVAMGGGRNGLESTWLVKSVLASVLEASWRVLAPWRVERPGAAHDWTDLAAPLPRAGAGWSPTSDASTSVDQGGFPLPLLPLSRYPPTPSTRSRLSALFICSPLPSERVCTTC